MPMRAQLDEGWFTHTTVKYDLIFKWESLKYMMKGCTCSVQTDTLNEATCY